MPLQLGGGRVQLKAPEISASDRRYLVQLSRASREKCTGISDLMYNYVLNIKKIE